MRQFFIGFLIVAALVVGGSLVASVAYQAGVSTAVTTVAATAPEGTVVTPVVPAYGYGYGYGYGPGWGWHGGFPIFGLLFGLFFIFLFIALLRAAFGRGRGWGGPGGGGWYGRGGWSNHEHNGERPWERQAREMHDAWHRQAGGPPADAGQASGPPAVGGSGGTGGPGGTAS
jgi:hypothetical protein